MLTETVIYSVVGVVLVILAIFISIGLIAKNYIKVPPNRAAVISGRQRKLPDGTTVGYRFVRGGAALVIPFLERVEYLNLNNIQLALETRRAYTKEGVPVSVKAVANVKINGDDQSLRAATERFLGVPDQELRNQLYQTLEGHLRAILGTLTVEQINNDRLTFSAQLTNEAAADLNKMGIGLDPVVIQEVGDELGYLDSLGKKRIAEVKRDADIGTANAQRDAKIKSAAANQEGEQARLSSEAEIAAYNKDTEIKKAQYAAAVLKERATADQAGPLASAIAEEGVVKAETQVQKAKTSAQIEVQTEEGKRKRAELDATTVATAEATKRSNILTAEGERESMLIRAQAAQQAAVIKAEGERQATIATAEAQAEKLRREGEGRAAAIAAEGQASATKIQAEGLAQAETIKATGLAEAEAILKKADAWKQFNEAAQLQTILDRLPAIIASTAPVFQAMSEPISGIDKLVVIDQGGGNGNGNHGVNSLSRLAQTSPAILFGFLEQLKATTGLDLQQLAQKLGVKEKEETKERSASA